MKGLKNILAELTYEQAVKLIGEDQQLLNDGGKIHINSKEQIRLTDFVCMIELPDATVTLTAQDNNLQASCNKCLLPCLHMGASLAVILEEKVELGLKKNFTEELIHYKSEDKVIEKALKDRTERASKEPMALTPKPEGSPWRDYQVTSLQSGKTYRVAVRGKDEAFCTCPDFRCNTLGTCKHIIFTRNQLAEHFSADQLNEKYTRTTSSLVLNYRKNLELELLLKDNINQEIKSLAAPLIKKELKDIKGILNLVHKIEEQGEKITIYPDAQDFIDTSLKKSELKNALQKISSNPELALAENQLLQSPVSTSELEKAAFGAAALQCIYISDIDSCQQKTALLTAKLLMKEAGIRRILISTNSSKLKLWQRLIQNECWDSQILVEGDPENRNIIYQNDAPFHLSDTRHLINDHHILSRLQWDMIILDDESSIASWNSQSAMALKSIESTYKLVLAHNSVMEDPDVLFSILNFTNEHIAGPAFQFFENFKDISSSGKTLGIKNKEQLQSLINNYILPLNSYGKSQISYTAPQNELNRGEEIENC